MIAKSSWPKLWYMPRSPSCTPPVISTSVPTAGGEGTTSIGRLLSSPRLCLERYWIGDVVGAFTGLTGVLELSSGVNLANE